MFCTLYVTNPHHAISKPYNDQLKGEFKAQKQVRPLPQHASKYRFILQLHLRNEITPREEEERRKSLKEEKGLLKSGKLPVVLAMDAMERLTDRQSSMEASIYDVRSGWPVGGGGPQKAD